MGIRLNKVLTELNIGTEIVVDYLKSVPGLEPTKEMNSNTKVTDEQYAALRARFSADKAVKEKADSKSPLTSREHNPSFHITDGQEIDIKVVGKLDLESINQSTRPKKKSKEERRAEREAKLSNKEKRKKVRIKGIPDNKEVTDQEIETLSSKNEIEYIDEHIQKICTIRLSQLRFEEGYITYRIGNDIFTYRHYGFPSYLNQYKNDPRFKSVSTQIILNYSNGSFSFVNNVALHILEDFKDKIEKETFEDHLKDLERKKEQEERVRRPRLTVSQNDKQEKSLYAYKKIISVLTSSLRFGAGCVTIMHDKRRYVYKDNRLYGYDDIIEKVNDYLYKSGKKTIKSFLVKVEIDINDGIFAFVDFDIFNYVHNLKTNFLPKIEKIEKHEFTSLRESLVVKQSSSMSAVSKLKTMKLDIRNIHFYNGYFLIFRTVNGEIDNAVNPYRVNDPDSHEILNLVHNYFEQRFEQMRIVVKHDDTKIFEPSRPDLFQLKNYVRALRRNLDVKGEWWDEVQNARKRSFGQCFGESTDSVKSRYVKSKNEYLYNLSSLQNERKLIRVYEINHGKEEDAFIFSINMSNDRSAIVFENASNDASTTTWLFVARNENYEDCVNLVFNYFTDYTILAKRSSLREANTNPPFKFKAESYTFIDHNDLGQWLKKLDKVLERTSKTSDIVFVPGLNIPQSSSTRTGHKDIVPTKNLHNQLMRKLYDILCDEHGKDYVGTEIRVGTKRIDIVVKGNDYYDIYEVKTATDPFDCVTEALGQLCQYAYLFCRDKIGKMVIVGASETNREVEQYLSWFRKKHMMEVYYMQVIL